MASSAEGGAVRQDVESAASQTATKDANDAADSSAAGVKDENPKSMFDAVKAIMDKDAQSSGAETQESESSDADDTSAEGGAAGVTGDKAQPKDDADAELGEVTDEELRGYKPKTRRRVEQLLASQRTLQEKVDRYEPVVASHQKLTTFIRDAGLTSEDVNAGFEIMRLMKTDPAKAWTTLQPIMGQLARITGNVLPNDLRQQVAEGRLDEAAATEMARLRANTTLSQQAADRDAEKRRRDTADREHQDTVTAIATAVSEWETKWSGSDPDYSLKRQRVQEKIELAFSRPGSRPKTPKEAVDLAERCRKEADTEIRRLRPAKAAVDDNTSASGGAAAQSKPQPKTLLEAVTLAAAARA